MKNIVSILLCSVAFFFISCSVDEKGISESVMSDLESGNLKVFVYSEGQIVKTHSRFNENERKKIEHWLPTLFESSGMSIVSYAPETLLRGTQLRVNFQSNRTIISYKEKADEKSNWNQHTRAPSLQDKEIKALLEKTEPSDSSSTTDPSWNLTPTK
jgi:hypothetical protein